MGYRGYLDQLEARRRALEDERREIDERLAEVEALEERRSTIERELGEVGSAIEGASAGRLPVIQVASPCNESWDAMAGDERIRFCLRCSKHVYNLSAMTTDETHSLIEETEGKLCVRFYQRRDGTVLTADCPEGSKRRRRHRAAALVAAATTAMAVTAIDWEVDDSLERGVALPEPPPPRVIMGGFGDLVLPAGKAKNPPRRPTADGLSRPSRPARGAATGARGKAPRDW